MNKNNTEGQHQEPTHFVPVILGEGSGVQNSAEITLLDIVQILWRGKILIAAVTMIFAVISIIVALNLPNIYKSSALVVPTSSDSGSGIESSLGGQLGGLASIAGLSIGNRGLSHTEVAIEVMTSRAFVSFFINKYDLKPELIAAEGWSHKTNEVVFDAELLEPASRTWIRDVSYPKSQVPSDLEAYEAFIEILFINSNEDTGVTTISIEHVSPIIAQQWVTWFVQEINEHMRTKDKDESTKSIQYLSDKLAHTEIAENRNILFQLIEEHTKTLMLTEVKDEYIFETLDPAFVPELKSKPKRALICIGITLFGLFIAVLVVLIQHSVKAQKNIVSKEK